MSQLRRSCSALLALVVINMVAAPSALAQATAQAPAVKDETFFDTWIISGSYETWFLLIPMSIVCIALLIDYLIRFRLEVVMPTPVRMQIQQMFEEKKYREVLDFTATEPSMLSYVVHSTLSEASSGFNAMERAMNDSVKEQVALMMARCEISNIIGQLAPMVGLFGTVRAMILAFLAMEKAGGETSPARAAAAGLRMAMVKTFWGLLIGTIGLAIYSFFRLHIVKLGNKVLHEGEELISVFKPGRAQQQPAGQAGAPRAAGPQPMPQQRR